MKINRLGGGVSVECGAFGIKLLRVPSPHVYLREVRRSGQAGKPSAGLFSPNY